MKRIPRFLFPLMVVVFLVALPLVLALAAGYRFDFKSGSIMRLGLIIVDGKPKQTRVMLDETTVGDKLPVKLKGVRPNFYSIRLESEGYHPLTFKRELRSGETLVISPVFLLRDAAPIPVRAGDVRDIVAHPSGAEFFVVMRDASGQSLWKFVPTRDEWTELYRTDGHIDWTVRVNRGGTMAMLSSGDSHRIVWADGSRVRLVRGMSPMWSMSDDDHFYYVDDGVLVRESALSGERDVTLQDVVHLVAVSSDTAWVVRSVSGVNQLISFSFARGEAVFIDTWDDTAAFALEAGDVPLIAHRGQIHRAEPNRLIALGPFDRHRIAWEMSRGGARMVAFTPFEVGVWQDGDDSIRTLARLGGDIRAAGLVVGTDYVLIARASDVVAIHTSSADRSFIVVVDDAQIDALISDERGTGVYLAGVIGGERGLFYVPLREE